MVFRAVLNVGLCMFVVAFVFVIAVASILILRSWVSDALWLISFFVHVQSGANFFAVFLLKTHIDYSLLLHLK